MTTIANIKVMMRTKPGGQNHILYSGSRTDVVDVVTHVVDEEVTEVGEEGCGWKSSLAAVTGVWSSKT